MKMDFLLNMLLSALLTIGLSAGAAKASDDSDAIEKEETASSELKDRPEWTSEIKEKYKLTDAQISSMQANGLNGPQMAMIAGLADKSGKSIEDVMKMRVDQKMGWGNIAKELGVHPSEIGHSVSDMRHHIKSEKHENKGHHAEKHKEKMEKRHEKQAARLEKKQKKMEKHNDDKGKSHGNGH